MKKKHKKIAADLFENEMNRVSPDDISGTAMAGSRKMEELADHLPSFLLNVWEDLKTMMSLLMDYSSGKYSEIPFKSIAAIAAAIIYFVSPVDAIPDIIPVLGFLDDAFVVGLALKMVREDLEAYRQWRHLIKMPVMVRHSD